MFPFKFINKRMKMTNFLLQEIKNVKSTDKKELSVKKLVALANARAAKLAKLNVSDFKSGINSGWSSIFNKILLPIFNLYLKHRNNFYYRLFRLVFKLYALAYVVSLIIALIIFGHDQYTHAFAFIKFQREILSEIRDSLTNSFNLIRRILTGYEPKPEPKGWNLWPSINDYQSKFKDYEKLGKLVDAIRDNPYQSDRELFLNRNLFTDSSNWYDFYKSPFFYIPVTAIVTGAAIYYNLDTIQNLGSKIVLPTIVTTVVNKVWNYMPSIPFRRTATTVLPEPETLFSVPSSRTSQIGVEDSMYFRNEAAEANKAIQEMEQQLADSDARAHAARTKMVAAINEMKSVANSLSNTPLVSSTPVASTSKLPDVLTSSSPIVDVADDGSEKAWIAQADSRSQSPTQQVESSPSHD
jgi:hypothetical protein